MDNLKFIQDLCGTKNIGFLGVEVVKELDRKDAHNHLLEERLRSASQYALDTFSNEETGGEWVNDLDGGDIQGLGYKHKLLLEREMKVPCGEVCGCADVYDTGQTATCYRIADWLLEYKEDIAHG